MRDWKKGKCCGTCALWDIDNAKTKSGAVQGHVPARCLWRSVEPRPEALRPRMITQQIPGFIMRDDGAYCTCYIKRDSPQHAALEARRNIDRTAKEM